MEEAQVLGLMVLLQPVLLQMLLLVLRALLQPITPPIPLLRINVQVTHYLQVKELRSQALPRMNKSVNTSATIST